ncbi:hypothetical protein CRE_13990 [Caenorhabditis remanei]|uniref:Protein kinase domain-containing protein n=1 Tax=Caenorhabditis remanei TaxID=31234 RepID=E3M8P0_CAERE|nr:hypothetical protein CRE_13990 [Caenorhabditis remanei]
MVYALASVEISYYDQKVIGNGSFGVVFLAKLSTTNEMVAIKKVLQDKRFKNRELQIMRKLNHPNIVKLKYFFYSSGDKKDELYLNLILEYVPETVYRVARHYSKQRQQIPMIYVKLYMYQLLRSLAYIHGIGICHRDIKPQNLLIDPETGVLKLCDFGSAKYLVRNEPNVSYICSRYYRAPELIFGATNYTNSIDVWSAGTVMAELLLGQPIFPGDSGVDQLVEIIKVLGTPTCNQLDETKCWKKKCGDEQAAALVLHKRIMECAACDFVENREVMIDHVRTLHSPVIGLGVPNVELVRHVANTTITELECEGFGKGGYRRTKVVRFIFAIYLKTADDTFVQVFSSERLTSQIVGSFAGIGPTFNPIFQHIFSMRQMGFGCVIWAKHFCKNDDTSAIFMTHPLVVDGSELYIKGSITGSKSPPDNQFYDRPPPAGIVHTLDSAT